MAAPQTVPTYDFVGGKFADGTMVNSSSALALGFYGTTPVTQRASSVAPAVATTAGINSSISSSCFGFTSAQCAAIIALVNELRAAAVALGLVST